MYDLSGNKAKPKIAQQSVVQRCGKCKLHDELKLYLQIHHILWFFQFPLRLHRTKHRNIDPVKDRDSLQDVDNF
jgi:hypothetical protein